MIDGETLRDGVFVLAPHFPSVNQPWIDTYLEQLQRSGFKFIVLTYVDAPGGYHKKVDRLRLRDHAVVVSPRPMVALFKAGLLVATRPRFFWGWWKKTRSILMRESTVRRAVGLAVRSLYYTDVMRRLDRLPLVHAHSLSMAYDFLPVVEFFQSRLILSFHGLNPSGVPQLDDYRTNMVFLRASRVLVNTKFAREQSMSLGCPSEKINIIPQGIDLEDFPLLERNPPEIGKCVRVLTVGRYHREKGQAYALLALARLLREGVEVEWHFVGEGPEKASLQSLAKRISVHGQACFHDGLERDALRRLYQESHFLVLASVGGKRKDSWVETQGVVIQEAQASGCVPVATKVGGIPECINDGVDGVLVADRSHREIANAILRLTRDADEWTKIQVVGRRNVEVNFSSSCIGSAMGKIIEDVIAGRKMRNVDS